MAKQLVPDELWAAVVGVLPPAPAGPKGGRPRVDDRAALSGILFVLRSGIPWEMLPAEMGCGSGMTCWRRLRDGHVAGVWQRLHQVLLDRLGAAGQVDWRRASVDAQRMPAAKGGPKPDRTRRTAASLAPSGLCSSTAAVRRWPCT
jgi:transposase